MIEASPIVLRPSWLVRFFARFFVLTPSLISVIWLIRHVIAQPEIILSASLEDFGMCLILLVMLASGFIVATTRVILVGDIIEKRTIFGRKRLQLSEIDCRCHYNAGYVAMVNLYAKNTRKRIFFPDMRVPVGYFRLDDTDKILGFIESVPVSDHCAVWRGII